MNAFKLSLILLLLVTACSGGSIEAGAADAAADDSFPDASPEPTPDAAPVDDVPDASPNDLPIQLACTLDDVLPIVECASENCTEAIADGSLLTCVTLHCGLLLFTLPPECSQCLLTGLGDSSMALDACVSGLDELDEGSPLPPMPMP